MLYLVITLFLILLGVLHWQITRQLRKEDKRLEAACTEQSERLAGALSEKSELEKSLAHIQGVHEQTLLSIQEKDTLLSAAKASFTQAFQVLSADALQKNQQSFLELAQASFASLQAASHKDLVERQLHIQEGLKPINELLTQVQSHIQGLEKSRLVAYTSLSEHLQALLLSNTQLKNETGNLVRALRTPHVRGQWGEMHLKRTVELAGMMDHVDFFEQATLEDASGRQRPDMCVHLPNGHTIVIDAKAPLEGYLNSLQAQDTSAIQAALQTHARHIKTHIEQLGSKQYWKHLSPSPEYVVLFLPSEAFFSAALESDPGLIEYGARQKVLLATPTSLIALLKAAAYGWQEAVLTKEAHTISALGQELYDRMCVFGEHLIDLRRSLERSVQSFNKAVSSVESRLLPSARKLKAFHHNAPELPDLPQLDATPTHIRSPELAVEN